MPKNLIISIIPIGGVWVTALAESTSSTDVITVSEVVAAAATSMRRVRRIRRFEALRTRTNFLLSRQEGGWGGGVGGGLHCCADKYR